ncbi:reverse transcriptase domain-containing protein [Desulfoluna spongiiphila]|uniref:Predicted amidohydrolase n=1 Tax=Desulfoluna spongiiphila TaxID=419481 RepID=A0A1G5HPW5_9BACT|nr:reverse transcriptase domain-containing protein [Desulfoluna spongiiphila]SCY65731.1 Predicted amidohydrolase [Desulfoluna spongiiphila]
MAVVDQKYRRLSPDIEFLSDEAVLAQAWKKCDIYIRMHNWYADILELEQASLMVPIWVKKWCIEVKKGDVEPKSDMRLVQAPKNAKWKFIKEKKSAKSWIYAPAKSEDDINEDEVCGPPLRPLAHLGIREQSLATAAMLCLADAVESMQGNTDQSTIQDAQEQGVYSYGNRLFCDWLQRSGGKQQARYRWGSAATYSQFFKDYERFLYRPSQVCQDALGQLFDEKLYVIKLDLSKFYDCIDRTKLINKLSKISADYIESFGTHITRKDENLKDKSEAFFKLLKQLMSWKWNNDDSINNIQLPDGLPQGLVAGGFFANAYMFEFDKDIGGLIKKDLPEGEDTFRLLDYCRYVDDMRVVVAAKKKFSALEVGDKLTNLFKDKLKAYCKGCSNKLTLNGEKTEVVPWEDYAVQGSTSRFMRDVQGQISQAPDPTTLANATGNLDHLLWLADTIEEGKDTDSNLPLANIAKPKMDVRDDTIQRFAANRLRTVLRLRRSMADPVLRIKDGVALQSVSEQQSLDHEIETIARKLIACWAKNPALTGVLRCGMDLFPSPDLLIPVLQALEAKIFYKQQDINENEKIVAYYILADLLKAGAIETGFHRDVSYPEHSDIAGYRNELRRLALVIVGTENIPWFVYQQASLYLAVMHYPVEKSNDLALQNYDILHMALKYEKPHSKNIEKHLCAGLIVLQLTGKKSHFDTWLCDWLNRMEPKKAVKLVDKIARVNPPTLINVCAKWKKNPKKSWYKHTKKKFFISNKTIKKSKTLSSWGTQRISLAAITNHPQNPFVQENALIKLAEALLSKGDEVEFDNHLSLHSLFIECEDWNSIQNPEKKIAISWEKISQEMPWCETPAWCQEDMQWAYHLGRLLRSSIIGEEDFTTRFYPIREIERNRFRGLNGSWYKRRMGLMPLGSGLGEEETPISPWMNELIMWLLQWPGLEIGGAASTDFDNVKSKSDLLERVKERKDVLTKYFGKLSNLPVYLLPVCSKKNSDLTAFKVGIVQTIMPLASDFCSKDPTFWRPEYRARHRAHLASMCRLVVQQLSSKAAASEKIYGSEEKLDLIVFPELAIHPDDMWLLSRLSDQTGATIFAGQTFVNHAYMNKPINRAVWLLRQESKSGRRLIRAFQGKQHGTSWEVKNGIAGHRPFQVVVEFKGSDNKSANLSGVICYDSTDIEIAADLREVTDGLLIAALNPDIHTFDSMVKALQYHMYQHIILANTGEFGGSTAQAPYKKDFVRLISHVHGNNQAVVSLFDVDLLAFKNRKNPKVPIARKTAPAGFNGRA